MKLLFEKILFFSISITFLVHVGLEANIELEKPTVSHFSTQTPHLAFSDAQTHANIEPARPATSQSTCQTEAAKLVDSSTAAADIVVEEKPKTVAFGCQMTPDPIPTSTFATQTAAKECRDASIEAKGGETLAHSETQTLQLESAEMGVQSETKLAKELGCQTTKGLGCAESAAQTVAEHQQPKSHREAQTDVKKLSELWNGAISNIHFFIDRIKIFLEEAFVQFATDPFTYPEVSQKLCKMEEECLELRSSLMETQQKTTTKNG